MVGRWRVPSGMKWLRSLSGHPEPAVAELNARAEQRRRLSCDVPKWSRDLARCTWMTAIGAMMEPGASGVDRAMLVGRPDAAGGHSDVSGGMTWKAAEVVDSAVYGTKKLVGRVRLLSVRMFY